MADTYMDSKGFDSGSFYDKVYGFDTSPGSKINFTPSGVSSVPSAPVTRVTPEGLNVLGVHSVSVAPDGTPILSAPQKAAAITKALIATAGHMGTRGSVGGGPSAGNASMTDNRLAPNGGIVSAYGEMRQSPAEQAIASALINTAKGSAFGGGWGSPGLTGLDFSGPSNNFVGVPAEGDAWSGLRFGEDVAPRPGLVTGSGTYGPVDALHAKLLAAQAPPQQQPGERFLQEQGQSTVGLTTPEISNALRAAMSGHQRGSFSV